MLGLLLAGTVILVVGILAIGFGIPVKEFSFGNTLIVTGVLGACTGTLLIALSLVLRELKSISLALGAGNRPTERPRQGPDPFATPMAVPAGAGPATGAPLPEDEHSGEHSHDAAAQAPPAPWQDELAARTRPPGEGESAAPEAPTKKRRNLLFMSTKRDRAASAEPLAPADDHTAAEPAVAAEPPASFEDAWPASDRPRPEAKRRAARPSDGSEAFPSTAAPPPLRRPAESPPVTILKSGVVDGMAYSLYSDGSIEAQMSEGMVRFASIDELRNHLDQRG